LGELVSANRERILNLPGVVSIVIVALTLIQFALEKLPAHISQLIFVELAFIPARLTYFFAPEAVISAIAEKLPEGTDASEIAPILNSAGRAWWTPLTYALLHSNWTHLIVNCVTLAAFGSPVARRFGPARFLVFFGLSAVAGALTHFALHPMELTPVIGASAAISGTMAAVARFAFTPGSFLGDRERTASEASKDTSLRHMVSNSRAMFFLAAWFGVNFLFGLFPQAAGAGDVIAWEAHIGGFFAGLFLFGLFDPRPSSGHVVSR
jgi:membrane associated rhomboid family serine protease